MGKAEREAKRQARRENRALKRTGRRERRLLRKEDRFLRRLKKGEFWDQKDEFWAKSEVERAAILDTAVSRRQRMKRRLVLGLILGVSAAGVLGEKFDAWTGDINWKPTESRVFRLGENPKWFPGTPAQEAYFTVGGLGCIDSWPHAHPMATEALGLPHADTPMSYLVSSNEGKTRYDVAQLILAQRHLSDEKSYYGQSYGGPVILEALRVLKEEKGIVIPIKRLILNCSPFDTDDVHMKFIADMVAVAPIEGGVISKLVYQVVDKAYKNRRQFFGHIAGSFRDSWHEAIDGESPRPWKKDLTTLFESDLNNNDYTGIITADTEIHYLMAPIDDVVYNVQARDKYAGFAAKYGAKFSSKMMPPGTTHGDSIAGGKTAKPWIPRGQNV